MRETTAMRAAAPESLSLKVQRATRLAAVLSIGGAHSVERL